MKREKVEHIFSPIGEFCLIGNKSAISVHTNYKKGVKYLEKFSHAIVIYLSDSCFKYKIVKIDKVDNQTGIIYLHDTLNIEEKVFDIKPYFPIEDRVRDADIPEILPKILYHNHLSKSDNEKYLLSPSGMIRKIEGEYYLYVNSDSSILLNDLNGFSHLRVFWWFDRFDKSKYRIIQEVDPPYEDSPKTGVFASRSPVRPNPIAMTTVKILACDSNNNRLKVSEMDCFDQTPLIDLVPYIPKLDRIDNFIVPEWLSHWPEWFSANEPNKTIEISNTKQKGIDVLNKYKILQAEKNTRIFSFKTQNTESSSEQNHIVIKGAKQNNLKNIDVKIPYGKITVVTGVSGSGKSSLVFDTLFTESQRRFMDSMSMSERRAFEQQDKPDVTQITGLPPAIAISQKSIGRNPRSTVGTITDINSYLALIFTTIGTRFCPDCGEAIITLKEKEIANLLSSLQLTYQLTVSPFNQSESEYTFIVSIEGNLEQRLKEALIQGKGAVDIIINQKDKLTLQTTQMCYHCNRLMFELTPSTFSFNNPESMCSVCKGLGVKMEVDIDKIITNPELSILDGASPYWNNLRKFRDNPNANWMKGELLGLADSMEIDIEKPWKHLNEEFRHQALFGSSGKEVSFTYLNKKNGRSGNITRIVEGAVNIIKRLFAENTGERAKNIADNFMSQTHCNCCEGERLTAEGRMVQVAETRFPQTLSMNMKELKSWIESLPNLLSSTQLEAVTPILQELHKLIENYIHIGIPYLTLDRSIPTLSGGELQRIKLANQLSSGISNILYVLDEPSSGLHPKDYEKLMDIINRLKTLGNTIVIVEHNEGIIKRADHLIDIGPKAGINGGYLVAEGCLQEVMENDTSETGLYLSGKLKVESQATFNPTKSDWIELTGLIKNNLKNIDISIPHGAITCITGVSGSGKSSLISILYSAVKNHIEGIKIKDEFFSTLTGIDTIKNIINITQQPIGRTPRSNPATYTGLMDEIRNLFASTKDAKKNKYKSNVFSFNSKEGQCPICKGDGRKCIEVHFMPDIWTLCPTCKGKRFNEKALKITFNGKNISDILDMNIEEALEFFIGQKKIVNILTILSKIGLGYIKLGQSALTLSGGEAQRIKLAKELATNVTGKTIYLLDEPTSGLHFSDIKNLLVMLRKIADSNNTVVIVEHNLSLIKNADWIIDLGSEGGEYGGRLVAQGTPVDIMNNKESYTGYELLK